MKSVRAGVGAAAVTAIVGAMLTAPGWGSAAEPERDSARRAPQRVVEARRHFFGSRNVDPRTGRVDPHKIILSWFGVSSFAASFGGHVVLLDAFVLRGYENDVPTTVDEVAALRPKAIFMGHTHGDHAGDLAELATRTGATVVGTPEHCRYARDQAGEAKIDCMTPVAAGAEPGAHSTFSPFPGLTVAAVKHLHSEQKPPTGTREPCPPPPTPPGDGPSHESGDYDWLLQPQVEGGSMLYQFRVGRFALTMHDSSGPIDRKAPRVVRVLRRLPRSDVQVGAVGSNGMFTNGMLSLGKYVRALRSRLFVPTHHDDFLPLVGGSGRAFKGCVEEELARIRASRRPRLRWVRSPEEYVDPRRLTFPRAGLRPAD